MPGAGDLDFTQVGGCDVPRPADGGYTDHHSLDLTGVAAQLGGAKEGESVRANHTKTNPSAVARSLPAWPRSGRPPSSPSWATDPLEPRNLGGHMSRPAHLGLDEHIRPDGHRASSQAGNRW